MSTTHERGGKCLFLFCFYLILKWSNKLLLVTSRCFLIVLRIFCTYGSCRARRRRSTKATWGRSDDSDRVSTLCEEKRPLSIRLPEVVGGNNGVYKRQEWGSFRVVGVFNTRLKPSADLKCNDTVMSHHRVLPVRGYRCRVRRRRTTIEFRRR